MSTSIMIHGVTGLKVKPAYVAQSGGMGSYEVLDIHIQTDTGSFDLNLFGKYATEIKEVVVPKIEVS